MPEHFDIAYNADHLTLDERENALSQAKTLVSELKENYVRERSNYSGDLHTFLDERYTKEWMDHVFWGLSLCRCCNRHMSNRPVSTVSNDTTPMLEHSSRDDSDCMCICRTTMRSLKWVRFSQLPQVTREI